MVVIMADLSVFSRIKSKEDFDRARQEFEMKKQLTNAQIMQAQKIGAGPAAVQEWQYYSNLGPEDQARYLQMKRSDQIMNLGNAMAVRNPTGGVSETYAVNLSPGDQPNVRNAQSYAAEQGKISAQLGGREGTAADVEARKAQAQGDAERRNKATESLISNSNTDLVINQLKEWNSQSPQAAFAEFTQPFRRLVPGTSEQEASVDLMRQARLDLAAPLAKQLGVNPTDKDFQASLDRIFDLNATRDSREKQINALAERLNAKKESDLSVMKTGGFSETPITQNMKEITIINPKTGEMLVIPEADFQAARKDGWMKK